jgi:hypothetical protein
MDVGPVQAAMEPESAKHGRRKTSHFQRGALAFRVFGPPSSKRPSAAEQFVPLVYDERPRHFLCFRRSTSW